MALILKTITCPACSSHAALRRRGGKYRQLDVDCPECGVLAFQTKAGQKKLTALLDKPESKPVSTPEPETGIKPESSRFNSTFFG